MERAMGIELHPKFLSLTETRCYQPLRESSVAKNKTRQSRCEHPVNAPKRSECALTRI